jgi:hypothetical protein
MKQGKVTNVIADGQYKDLNKYKVTIDDNKTLTFFAKAEFKKSVGDSLNYEITNEKYNVGKLLMDNPNYGIKKNTNEMIIRQTCIKASAEFNAQSSATIEDVLVDAQRMYDWINK